MAGSEQTIQEWANRLRYFRFFRGVGGHTNDGETLRCAFVIETVAELRTLFQFLGIELVEYSERPVGTDLIPGTRWIAQPNWTSIADQRVMILADYDRTDLFIGMNYEITEEDVVSAEAIEQVLESVPFQRIDPPHKSDLYVMPMG
jgi:hypothetical protein